MAPLVWTPQPRSKGVGLLAAVKQVEESPWLKRHKVLSSPMLRYTASILAFLMLLHMLLSHQSMHGPAPKAILLPATKDLPKQVTYYSTCPADMPLFEQRRDILSADVLGNLQASLRNSSWLVPFGRRTGKVGTKGVVVRFNVNGVDRLQEYGNMTELATFFHRERLPSANAWSLTLVAAEACPGFRAEQGIWAIHRDELPSASGGPFADGNKLIRVGPHSVTVFDVDAPDSLMGGAMWLWQTNSSAIPVGEAPSGIVPPRLNSKFTFRGDAFHGIIGQNSTQPGPLISIVLEQYKVPTPLYSQTVDFMYATFRTEYRAKRPDKRVYHPVTDRQRREVARMLKQIQN